MKKILIRGLFFGIFFVIVVVACMMIMSEDANADATPNHYVDPTSQNPTPPYTSQQTAAHTIQPAINVAGTNDNVWVAAATYTPSSTILISNTKIGLKFIGSGRTTTIIDGNSFNGDILDIKADNVEVKKFTIKNSGVYSTQWPQKYNYAGIMMQGAELNLITGCKIYDMEFNNVESGIWMQYADQNTIGITGITNKIFFTNCIDDSITLDLSDQNTITNIEITQDDDNRPDGTMYLRAAVSNTFDSITILQNYDITISKYYDGFYFEMACSYNTIKNSNIKNTETGVNMRMSDDNIIINNNIFENKKTGISLLACEDNTIKNNKIYDNGKSPNLGDGIYLGSSVGNVIEENGIYNTLSGFQGRGIYMSYALDNKILNNNDNFGTGYGIYRNKRDGIYIRDSIDTNLAKVNQIIGNKIFENRNEGIEIKSSTNIEIKNNWIYDNANNLYPNQDGVLLDDSNDNIFEGNIIYNTVNGKQKHGIHLSWNSDGNKIQNGNDIYKNKLDGIFIERNSDNNQILGNIIRENVENGIHIKESNNNYIQKYSGISNDIKQNDKNGIYLEICTSTNYIKGNDIYSNDLNGIYLDNSNNQQITNINNIYNNKKDGILLIDSDSNNIEGNNIYNTGSTNQDNGIHLHMVTNSPTNNYIQNSNIIYSNNENGIYIESCTIVNYIKGNTIRTNTLNGIKLYNSDNQEITNNNKIYNNKEDGIYLEDSDDNTIKDNEIYDTVGNQNNGIHLKNSYDNIIESNDEDLSGDSVFGINNNQLHGIYLESCDDTEYTEFNEIKSNKICSNGENGIHLYDSTYIQITSINKIYDNKNHGIALFGNSDENTINGNLIYGNDWDDVNGGDGIYLDGSDDNTIEANEITGAGSGYQKYGVHLKNSFDNVIINNNGNLDSVSTTLGINSNNQDGIYFEYCDDTGYEEFNEVKGNIIHVNIWNGIHLSSSNSIKITDNNLIYNNQLNGILFENSGLNTISENEIKNIAAGTQQNGISLQGTASTFNLIEKNNIHLNKQNGIYLYQASTNVIRLHKDIDEDTWGIYKNDKHGIYMKDVFNNNIQDNYIYNNDKNIDGTGDGIYLEDCYGSSGNINIIEKNGIYNDVFGNQQYGIHFYNTVSARIENNNKDYDSSYGIWQNKKDGIFLDNCIDSGDWVNEIKGNSINDNVLNGIHLKDSSGNKILYDFISEKFNDIYDNEQNGIFLENSDNNNIEGSLSYNNNDHGIYLDDSDENYIEGNVVYHNDDDDIGSGDGVRLENSNMNTFFSNVISNVFYEIPIWGTQNYGIYMISSDDNDIIQCIINENDEDGIYLDKDCDYNLIDLTSIDSNGGHGVAIIGEEFTRPKDNVIQNYCNIDQNGENGIYLKYAGAYDHPNVIDLTDIDSNGECGIKLEYSDYNVISSSTIYTHGTYSGIKLINSDSNTITGNNLGANYYGIYLDNSHSNTIEYSDIDDHDYGIYLDNSDSNTIDNENDIYENDYGIYLYYSGSSDTTKNIISNNELWGNEYGIYIDNSDSNAIDENIIFMNDYGIYLYDSGSSSSIKNTIYYNELWGNEYGIYIDGSSSTGSCNNEITYNMIYDNTNYGIYISQYCDNNKIHHNNFINNNDVLTYPSRSQAWDDGSGNAWDDGAEGNYWSNYQERYPDGEPVPPEVIIWDTPYAIDGTAGSQDNYPLIYPPYP